MNYFQRLHDDLNDEVDEQTKIMEKLRDSLTRLNLIGDEISALPTDELDRHIAQMNTIQERLEDLIPTARIVDSAIDRPAKYILRPPVDRPLVERIVELQSILRERHEAATQLVQLKTVTPAINSVNDVLDTMLGQLEQAPVESLESQQAILEDLENNQRRLEQTLSELPPGKEADALRERSQWNLSRLKDWLKRLADAVGDRLAALAAFNATRDHVTRQVADLYNQNTSDASNESDIEGRIQQLLKLRTTLANATSDQLDTNSLKEAEILQQKIDEAIEQFQVELSLITWFNLLCISDSVVQR